MTLVWAYLCRITRLHITTVLATPLLRVYTLLIILKITTCISRFQLFVAKKLFLLKGFTSLIK